MVEELYGSDIHHKQKFSQSELIPAESLQINIKSQQIFKFFDSISVCVIQASLFHHSYLGICTSIGTTVCSGNGEDYGAAVHRLGTCFTSG